MSKTTFEQKRQLIELLVDRVVVTDEEVEIRYVIPTSKSSEHVRFCHLRLDYFHDPTRPIPLDALPGLLEGGHRHRGQQDPLQGLHPFGWCRFPHVHHPHHQRMLLSLLWATRRKPPQAAPTDQDVGRAGLDLLGRLQVQFLLAPGWPATHHKVALQLPAEAEQREHIAGPIPHVDPLHAGGWGSNGLDAAFPHLRLALALPFGFSLGAG